MQKIKVLLVEDEMLVATDLEYQLSTLGYEVCAIAKSGSEALRNCEIHQPDLVLMDIRIKGEIDGIDTAIKISDTYDIPIIFLSDLKDKETLERAKKAKSHSFLEKPITEFNLNTSIEFAIENHFSKKPSPLETNNPLKDLLLIKADSGYIKLLSGDILWIEANGAYCQIKTAETKITLSKNMREFCEHLDSRVFIKIHKSYTINATKIDRIDGAEVSIGNEKLKIGRSYFQSFKVRLNIV